MKALIAAVPFLLSPIAARGQVTIEPAPELKVPAEEVRVAYRVARQQIIAELSPAKPNLIPEARITLKVGGCSDPAGDYYETEDVQRGATFDDVATVCLKSWDVEKFTYAVMRITERRLIPPKRYLPMLKEGLSRIRNIAPVDARSVASRSRPGSEGEARPSR